MTNDGAGRGTVHNETNLIPPQTPDTLARCPLALLRNISATPGGREMLDREKAAYLAEREAAGKRKRS